MIFTAQRIGTQGFLTWQTLGISICPPNNPWVCHAKDVTQPLEWSCHMVMIFTAQRIGTQGFLTWQTLELYSFASLTIPGCAMQKM